MEEPDGRIKASRVNAKKAGCPSEKQFNTLNKATFKTPERQEELAENVVQALIEKGKFRESGRLNEVSGPDREALRRLAEMSVEDFNKMLMAKFQSLSVQVMELFEEHVRNKAILPNHIAFAMAVVEDKRARLAGRTQLSGMQINQQVNIFGVGEKIDREKVMKLLNREAVEGIQEVVTQVQEAGGESEDGFDTPVPPASELVAG